MLFSFTLTLQHVLMLQPCNEAPINRNLLSIC